MRLAAAIVPSLFALVIGCPAAEAPRDQATTVATAQPGQVPLGGGTAYLVDKVIPAYGTSQPRGSVIDNRLEQVARRARAVSAQVEAWASGAAPAPAASSRRDDKPADPADALASEVAAAITALHERGHAVQNLTTAERQSHAAALGDLTAAVEQLILVGRGATAAALLAQSSGIAPIRPEAPAAKPAMMEPAKPPTAPAEPAQPAAEPVKPTAPSEKPAEKPAETPAEKPVEKPAETPVEKPADPAAPAAEAPKPMEPAAPAEAPKPAEPAAEAPKPAEPAAPPAEAPKPAEPAAEAPKPAEPAAPPAEAPKPEEKPAEAPKPEEKPAAPAAPGALPEL